MRRAWLKSFAVAAVDSLRMADSRLRSDAAWRKPQRLGERLRASPVVKLARHLLP